MRIAALLFSVLLVCGCGGGGSDTPAPATEPDLEGLPAAEPDLLLEQTLAVLESCTLAELSGLVELLDLFQGVTEPGAEMPSFQITGFDLGDASVDWTVDLDLDEEPDVSGAVAFRDAEGEPTFPFNPLDLLGSSLDLETLLASIEDGTVVAVDYAVLRGVETIGTLAFTVAGGLPSAIAGNVVVNGTDCVITLAFEALEIDPELGTYPSGEADLTVEGGDATLDGTITFDGTSVVTIDLGPPGEASYAFEYDLETGQLTPPGT